MVSESHARPSALRADAARNRAAVLEAARARLAVGDDALPMNVIAKEVGVGVGTVYRHFPDRQMLLEALAIDAFERLAVVAADAAADPDVDVGLARFFRAVVAAELDDPGLAAVLDSDSFACSESTAAGRALIASGTTLLDRGVSAGLIAPEIEPADVQKLLSGVAHALRGRDDRDRLDRYVTVLLRGMRPQARTGG